jgi:hypothetical protein
MNRSLSGWTELARSRTGHDSGNRQEPRAHARPSGTGVRYHASRDAAIALRPEIGLPLCAPGRDAMRKCRRGDPVGNEAGGFAREHA